MKYILLTLSLFILNGIIAQDWTNKNRALPDELRKVPVNIFIKHGPNPNYPELSDKEEKYKYVWKHQTSVISPEIDLQVIKTGSYIWYNEEGWKKNVVYNKRDFAKRFNCPKGKLIAGQQYTFKKNYRYGNNLYGGDALWYVIAKDAKGNIYKGMALLETEAELQANNN